MHRPRWLGFLVVATCVAFPGVARARDPETVEWSSDWPRVQAWEAIGAVVLTVGDTEFERYVPIQTATWRGGILFDDWARGVFRGRTHDMQVTASSLSDGLFYGGTLVPFIVDDFFVALDVHRNADVALQMFVINMQSLGISGLTSLAAEHGVGRARPYTLDCGPDGLIHDPSGALMPNHCGTQNDDRSFFSGHVAAVTTMAGLTCIHHQHLPLYGGGLADLAPCVVMIAASVATGLLRLVYDEHWASDVMVGWLDGALSGYVLPAALHYGFGGSGPATLRFRAGDLTVAPMISAYGNSGARLGVIGSF
jgi:hypothetical protein